VAPKVSQSLEQNKNSNVTRLPEINPNSMAKDVKSEIDQIVNVRKSLGSKIENPHKVLSKDTEAMSTIISNYLALDIKTEVTHDLAAYTNSQENTRNKVLNTSMLSNKSVDDNRTMKVFKEPEDNLNRRNNRKHTSLSNYVVGSA
jgi:hypothetical protein